MAVTTTGIKPTRPKTWAVITDECRDLDGGGTWQSGKNSLDIGKTSCYKATNTSMELPILPSQLVARCNELSMPWHLATHQGCRCRWTHDHVPKGMRSYQRYYTTHGLDLLTNPGWPTVSPVHHRDVSSHLDNLYFESYHPMANNREKSTFLRTFLCVWDILWCEFNEMVCLTLHWPNATMRKEYPLKHPTILVWFRSWIKRELA